MPFEPPTSLLISVRHVSNLKKRKRVKTWTLCKEHRHGKEHSVAGCRECGLCLRWGKGHMRAYMQPLDFCLVR